MTKETIILSSATAYVKDSIMISSTGGVDIDHTTLTWKVQGSATTHDITKGNFIFTASTFEPLFTTASDVTNGINIVFTLTSYGFEEEQTISDTSVATCNLKITDEFAPRLYITKINYDNLVNGHIRAATSNVRPTYSVDYSGTSPVTITVTNIVSAAAVTYVIGSTDITFTLPQISAETYTLAFRVVATNGRGQSSYVDVAAGTIGSIYCYDAPGITITSFERCDSEGSPTANGNNIKVVGSIADNSTKKTFTITINSITSNITLQPDKTFTVIAGNNALDVSIDYQFTLSYLSDYMYSQSYSAITTGDKLVAQRVPISLIDDGSVRGMSVGEMAQNYEESSADNIINYSDDTDIRARNGNTIVVESAYNVVNANRYIQDVILGELKFVALSENQYYNLRNKDSNTIYFVY